MGAEPIYYASVFIVVALIAALLGFTGVAGMAYNLGDCSYLN
jgi:uncharacterized membrane protein YtjA (UPF0391 family)